MTLGMSLPPTATGFLREVYNRTTGASRVFYLRKMHQSFAPVKN